MISDIRLHAEWAVVGAAISNPSLLPDIDLSADELTDETAQCVYRTVLALADEGSVPDCFSVAERLSHQTGRNYLQTVSQMALLPTADVASYVASIKNGAQRTRGEETAQRLIDRLRRGEVSAIDDAVLELMALGENSRKRNYECTLPDSLKAAAELIKSAAEREGGLTGIPTCSRELNAETGGFHGSDLYFIGGRPAMGKTAFLCNCIMASGVESGFITGEQGRAQIGMRLMAMQGAVPLYKMRLGNLDTQDWENLRHAARAVNKAKVNLYDRGAPTLSEVMRVARKWVYSHGIKILYIDYLQRIRIPQARTKTEEVAEVCLGMKELARDLNIPVVVLAQINRDVEKRADRRPFLSDFLHSGAIEQEADVVMTLYRDEVYEEESRFVPGYTELSILKNRHGRIGTMGMFWQGEYLKFSDIEPGTAVTKMVSKPKRK